MKHKISHEKIWAVGFYFMPTEFPNTLASANTPHSFWGKTKRDETQGARCGFRYLSGAGSPQNMTMPVYPCVSLVHMRRSLLGLSRPWNNARKRRKTLRGSSIEVVLMKGNFIRRGERGKLWWRRRSDQPRKLFGGGRQYLNCIICSNFFNFSAAASCWMEGEYLSFALMTVWTLESFRSWWWSN